MPSYPFSHETNQKFSGNAGKAPTSINRKAAWKHLLILLEEGVSLGGGALDRDVLHDRF